MEQEKQVLIVLAKSNFNEDEYEYTRRALEDNGIGVRVAATELGVCIGKNGTTVEVEVSFSDESVGDYSAIIFIGGPGVDIYFKDENALLLARKYFSSNKIVAAICWAPIILAKAGILAQRKATVWENAKDDLIKSGAIYTGETVTVDNTIVTASGPEAASKFGQTIAELLNK